AARQPGDDRRAVDGGSEGGRGEISGEVIRSRHAAIIGPEGDPAGSEWGLGGEICRGGDLGWGRIPRRPGGALQVDERELERADHADPLRRLVRPAGAAAAEVDVAVNVEQGAPTPVEVVEGGHAAMRVVVPRGRTNRSGVSEQHVD